MDVKGTTWFVRNQRTKSSYTGNEVMSAIIYTFKAVSCLPCSQTRRRAVDQFLAKRRVRVAATCLQCRGNRLEAYLPDNLFSAFRH
jgi:predicted LPLAT superfamily acyltransferase